MLSNRAELVQKIPTPNSLWMQIVLFRGCECTFPQKIGRKTAESLSFYHPRPTKCLDQILTLRTLSQHLVSSSTTTRANISRNAQCLGHYEMIWSAICSVAPLTWFVNGARHHLYINTQKRTMPERRNRLSLTQNALDKPMCIGPVLSLDLKARIADILL